MFKVYKSNTESDRYRSILICDGMDGDKLSGCLISHIGQIGFSKNWITDFFQELKHGEEISLNLDSHLNSNRHKIKLIGDKLIVSSNEGRCIVDLTNKRIISKNIKEYLSTNPIKIQFKCNSVNGKLKLFKSPPKRGIEYLLIYDKYNITDNKRECITGSLIYTNSKYTKDNGYYDRWSRSAFEECDEITFDLDVDGFLNNGVILNPEVRGNKLLIKSNNYKDSIIDINKGEINLISIEEFKEANPLILKFKNKI